MNHITLPALAKARNIDPPGGSSVAKCFMCGTQISQGILCEKCDKPRRPKRAAEESAAPPKSEPQAPPVAPAVPPRAEASAPGASVQTGTARSGTAIAAAVQADPFPKAPVVPFPVSSASLAVTSVVDLLIAAGVASVLVAPDRTIKFISDEAKSLFGSNPGDTSTLQSIESKTGIRVADLSIPSSAGVRIGDRSLIYSLVPLSGGAGGAVLVFRSADGSLQTHGSFVDYVREAVFGPLSALRELTIAAAQSRGTSDPLLHDVSATLDQVLSSLELAPEVSERINTQLPTVTDIVHKVASRFGAHADLKGIRLQVDAQDLEERFRDHEQLGEALGILMDNAIHYVPAGGQVVIGVRWMEHKGKPLLLFFVMDNGPLVPESVRHAIFESDFVWNPSSAERTGRGLFKTRDFAVAHAGSVWVEARTGKACTFFLRVRPDGAT